MRIVEEQVTPALNGRGKVRRVLLKLLLRLLPAFFWLLLRARGAALLFLLLAACGPSFGVEEGQGADQRDWAER